MLNNGIPYINGQLYDWGQITAMIAGVPVVGIIAIEYGESQETTPIFASGRMMIGVGKGRITANGSITLLEEEIRKLRDASDNGRLQDITPFDITVTFLAPNEDKVQTHVLKNCMFTNDGVTANEGDTSLSQQLTLVLSHIEWKQ